MSFMTIIKIILGSLPFIVLCICIMNVNMVKFERYKQFILPFITAIYCFVAVKLASFIHTFLEFIINVIKSNIPFLGFIQYNSIAIYLFNFVIVLMFLPVKRIVMALLQKYWTNKELIRITSGYIYTYDPECDKWFVKEKIANIRQFYLFFYAFLLIGSSLLFTLSQMYRSAAAFKAIFYPVCGIIILGEVINFISGMTKTEYFEEILFEDEATYRVSNYGILRKILRELFQDHVLYESTIDTTNGIENSFSKLIHLSKSTDKYEKKLGKYFLTLKEKGFDIDINYVDCAIGLLKGKSVVVNNPFYRDLTNYLMLPITKQLMSYKKILIVASRDNAAEDIKEWIDEGTQSIAGTANLWTSKILDMEAMEGDIGIIKFCDIYNLKLHQANKDFLSKVGMVIIVEPSRILSTGQIGLNLLVNQCEQKDKEILYLACDRNCDGVVDTLSHVLKTNLTEVTATLSGSSSSSQMFWDANGNYMQHKIFPNVSRYLGIGTELSAVGMKYQIPEMAWIGSEKFPVTDMRWIAGQYYKQICSYAGITQSQDELNRRFKVNSSLWSFEKNDNSFLIVEDEFQNLFEMTRVFSSRARKQGFVNVISENYLLRDYMVDNVDIFNMDPKAIPTIVPDYARSERNVILKLMMLMVNGPIEEERMAKEFMLCNISYSEPYITFKELLYKHFEIQDATLTVIFKENLCEDGFNTEVTKYYQITEDNPLYKDAQNLKNAYYILEDEVGEIHHIGAKLYGHVFQSILPGQYKTFDGKYYEVQTINPKNGVVLRRASDHIDNRHYYRQIQRIILNSFVNSSEMGAVKMIDGIEIIKGYAHYEVETKGYLDLTQYDNLKNGKLVLISDIPVRQYKNKNMLKIRFPEISENQRYTLCMMLNEIFNTTYPNSKEYIKAITKNSLNDELLGVLDTFEGNIEEDCIYIEEDSDIDLGLLVSVERNLKRYLEIIVDFIDWHHDKMSETAQKDDEQEEYVPDFTIVPPSEKKKSFVKKSLEKIKNINKKIGEFFKKLWKKIRRKRDDDSDDENKPEIEETDEDIDSDGVVEEDNSIESEEQQDDSHETEFQDNSDDLTSQDESNDIETKDSTSVLKSKALLFDNEEIKVEDDSNSVDEEIQISADEEETTRVNEELKTKYQKTYFLKFGYDEINSNFDIEGLFEYLKEFDFDKSSLHEVRRNAKNLENNLTDYDPHKFGAHLCDFCGRELIGSYDVLNDGRERCISCSQSVISTAEEFRQIYKSVIRNMDTYFGIKISGGINVKMTDAKTVAKAIGEKFVATPGFDGRVLGFARKDKTGYTIYLENGAPRISAIQTLAHELTHIWQYQNWDDKKITDMYGKQYKLLIYEGMAKWAELQYLIFMNEKEFAKREEIRTRQRNDEYGIGFIMYADKYPLCYETILQKSPFKEERPL